MKNIDDDGKLGRKYHNKKSNVKKHNLKFLLTYEEFTSLVVKAGLKSSQLGFTGEGYVLARYGDRGPYKIGNCRFITQAENMKERVWTRKSNQKRRSSIRARIGKSLVLETRQTCQVCKKKFFSDRLRQVCSIDCRSNLLRDGRSISSGCLKSKKDIEKLQRLHSKGCSTYQIAEKLGWSRNTVSKYLRRQN